MFDFRSLWPVAHFIFTAKNLLLCNRVINKYIVREIRPHSWIYFHKLIHGKYPDPLGDVFFLVFVLMRFKTIPQSVLEIYKLTSEIWQGAVLLIFMQVKSNKERTLARHQWNYYSHMMSSISKVLDMETMFEIIQRSNLKKCQLKADFSWGRWKLGWSDYFSLKLQPVCSPHSNMQ